MTRLFLVKSIQANPMPLRSTVARSVLFAGFLGATMTAAGADEPAIKLGFENVVHPFLKNHCLACHGAEKPKAKLDLSIYSSRGSRRQESPRLGPRAGAARGGGDAARESAAAAHAARAAGRHRVDSRPCATHEARRNAGDPGPVLARRLSNAEFDYTIRDLTGVDIRPTREFPVDPANEAGFDNSGESLTMSPALVEKYLAAAQAGRRPSRPEARRLRLRAAPGGHRYRPRQILRPAHRRLLPAAPGRLCRLLPGRLAVPAPRRPSASRRRRLATSPARPG